MVKFEAALNQETFIANTETVLATHSMGVTSYPLCIAIAHWRFSLHAPKTWSRLSRGAMR